MHITSLHTGTMAGSQDCLLSFVRDDEWPYSHSRIALALHTPSLPHYHRIQLLSAETLDMLPFSLCVTFRQPAYRKNEQ
jgi:hypothetical protein